MNTMPNRTYPRIKTSFPGVFYRETEAGKVFYILYRQTGERRLIEDRLTGKRDGVRALQSTFEGSKARQNAKIKEMTGKIECRHNRPPEFHLVELSGLQRR